VARAWWSAVLVQVAKNEAGAGRGSIVSCGVVCSPLTFASELYRYRAIRGDTVGGDDSFRKPHNRPAADVVAFPNLRKRFLAVEVGCPQIILFSGHCPYGGRPRGKYAPIWRYRQDRAVAVSRSQGRGQPIVRRADLALVQVRRGVGVNADRGHLYLASKAVIRGRLLESMTKCEASKARLMFA